MSVRVRKARKLSDTARTKQSELLSGKINTSSLASGAPATFTCSLHKRHRLLEAFTPSLRLRKGGRYT